MLLGIIFVIIFLSILVLVHELGHFLAAKKFGLWVEEFGFGLPPRIWGKKIGETLYSINALPFGGFVKIYGEDREEKITQSVEKISAAEIKEDIVVSENQLTVVEKLTVEENTISDSRNFGSISVWKRAIITFAGVLMNFILGWLLLVIIFSVGTPQGIVISEIQANSPAAKVGLLSGDVVLGVSAGAQELKNEINVNNFIQFVNAHQGQEIVLKIGRNGQTQEFKAVPRVNPPSGEGALGIAIIETGLPKTNFFSALWTGLKTSVQLVGAVFVAVFTLIKQIFIGQANLEQIAGPVGIVKITSQAESLGFIYLLQLLALISINLVAINILPFPALDGGRLLFLLIEKVKGSPLPVKFERYANAAGMTVLLLLMVAITVKDIIKF